MGVPGYSHNSTSLHCLCTTLHWRRTFFSCMEHCAEDIPSFRWMNTSGSHYIQWLRYARALYGDRYTNTMAKPETNECLMSLKGISTWASGWSQSWIAKLAGFGGLPSQWNTEQYVLLWWDGSWDQQCIAAKELLPIALTCTIWGAQWQHRQVLVWCDKMVVVIIMASQTSRTPLPCIYSSVWPFSEHYTTSCIGTGQAYSRDQQFSRWWNFLQ